MFLFPIGNAICSASLSQDGWAWFVIGRRLFIWQATKNKQIFGANCKELSLPTSDLAYSANLISVFSLHGHQVRKFFHVELPSNLELSSSSLDLCCRLSHVLLFHRKD